MATYGRVSGGIIREIFTTDLDIHTLFNSALVWIDVSATVGADVGWSVGPGNVLAAPDDAVLTTEQKLTVLAAQHATSRGFGISFQPAGQFLPAIFATDPTSLQVLFGAYGGATAGLWLPGDNYLDANGDFIQMNAAEIIYLAKGAFSYVLACGRNAAALAVEINAGGSPDVTIGWPSAVLPPIDLLGASAAATSGLEGVLTGE